MLHCATNRNQIRQGLSSQPEKTCPTSPPFERFRHTFVALYNLATHGASETLDASTGLIFGRETHGQHVEAHGHMVVPDVTAVEFFHDLFYCGCVRPVDTGFIVRDEPGPRASPADANGIAVGTLGPAQHHSRCEL